MKKFLITTALTSFICTSAFAKTEGSYIGVDFLSNRVSYYTKVKYPNGDSGIIKPTERGGNFGAGINYKYAFNFNNFFFAPGIFAEQISFGKSKTNGTNEDSLQVKNRYGARLDLGYDIGDYVSPYVTGGYSGISYRSVSDGVNTSNKIVTATRNANTGSFFFGGGIKFTLSKSLALNFEYNMQKFNARSAIPNGTADYISKYTQVSRIDIAKVGLSYNF